MNVEVGDMFLLHGSLPRLVIAVEGEKVTLLHINRDGQSNEHFTANKASLELHLYHGIYVKVR